MIESKRWWREPERVRCSGCGTHYVKGRPAWTTCLACECKLVRGDWTPAAVGDFIATARAAFPRSHEPPRTVPVADVPAPSDLQLFEDEAA